MENKNPMLFLPLDIRHGYTFSNRFFFQVLSVEEDFNTRATDEWRVWKVTAKYRGPKERI